VEQTLGALSAAATEPTTNVMPAVLDAVRAYATVGEIIGTLASVFGRWAEDPVV
jgi:methylmalonyl-CoA mutase N-terminal domain/subunit